MFADWLKAQTAGAAERTALITADGERWTYAGLDNAVDAAAGRLAGLGLKPGDFLTTLLPASRLHVSLVHAAARLGLIFAPLNSRLTAAELQPQIQMLGCQLLVGKLSELQTGVLQNGLRVLGPDEFESLPTVDFNPAEFKLENLQAVIFTSGTTGHSKGVRLTFANHFYSALGSAARLGMLPSDVWLSPLPLYHVGGLANLFRCALAGAALQVSQPDSAALAAGLAAGASLVSLVPTMLKRLLDLPDLDFPRLRLVLLGGAAAAPELLAQAASRRLRVVSTYGLTEASSQVATVDPDSPDQMRKTGTAGRPLLNTSLKIVDEEGADVPPEQPGEVLVKGPTVMAGYYQDPSADSRTLKNGWLYTGDIGYLDHDGCLFLLQRRSDLIISGGENIYPAEIEQALLAYPAVEDVCVVGLADAEWGQRPAALVVLRAGQTASQTDLTDHLRRLLAGYKVPKNLYFAPALPLTASGKVSRRLVQERLEQLEAADE